MSDWYSRQFGDREQFALSVSFGRDPSPWGVPSLDATWGGLAIWIRGRCMTRSISDEGLVADEIRWSLFPILQWLTDVAVRLVNEEPFPQWARSTRLRDACAWIIDTETPSPALTDSESDEWFQSRSDWCHAHALRRAAVDVALPNLVLRRVGDQLEASWDNETWATSHRGLSFVEKRGTVFVPAEVAAAALLEALRIVSGEVAAKFHEEALSALAEKAKGISITPSDWKWLVHPQTAEVIRRDLGEMASRLDAHTQARGGGIFVPHSPETLLLRHMRGTTAIEVQDVMAAGTVSRTTRPLSAPLAQHVLPRPAPSVEPWREGYERAYDLRENLGWGSGPAPDLKNWLPRNNVATPKLPLPPRLALLTIRTPDLRCQAVVNSAFISPIGGEMGLATALGHLLMDETPAGIDGAWEHWPTAARARAFGAMLLLPDEGVRDCLGGKTHLTASDVQSVMERFGTGPKSTTWHLMNRNYLDEERRQHILNELEA